MTRRRRRSYAEVVRTDRDGEISSELSRSEEESQISITDLTGEISTNSSQSQLIEEGDYTMNTNTGSNQDNPGLVLVSTVLNGRNYLPWRRSMLLAINAKLKSSFILRDEAPQDVNSDAFLKWKETDDLVFSWILNALAKDIGETLMYATTAKALWEELELRYNQRNGPLIFQLRREICGLTQGGMNLVEFFGRMKRLWDEYAIMRPHSNCTCGESKKIAQTEQLMQFLSGLNPEFDHVRDQILLMDPLPGVNKAYAMLMMIDKQHHVEIAQGEFVNLSTGNTNRRPAANNYRGGNNNFNNFNSNTNTATGSGSSNCGTVEFEIPGDVADEALSVRSERCNAAIDDDPVDAKDPPCIPPLQIVMLIVGTRGDVQPFIAIGKRLQDYGHRVRLATHANFKEFVLTAGLEFFPLGGDPKVLAGYMVKNKGFLPSGPSEIPIQRNQIKDVIHSLLPACKDPDVDSGIPFKADAIIANPPAYGHTHVAEALNIPIHIFFTMPWTQVLSGPTSEFPHPLSCVKQPAGYRLSYQIDDSLIRLGIRDMINDFRKKKLKLRPVTYLRGSQGWESDAPHGYIWSPHLVPKPKDWGHKIDVVGFCFLDLASNYEPPEPLMKWLEAGPKPIYIGFGSLPVQEPQKMTQIIVDALEQTGQRGIINKGWGGLGDLAEPKESIYLLDNCPHDWLFLQCKAVVHHGGAGTTAAGLKAACPTTIVPFFGDQPFWGERVHARGVGPSPIPVDEFSLPKLVGAINFMLDPQVKERAVELAKAMENEDGVEGAVKAFFDHLPWKKPELEPEPEPSSFFSFSKWPFSH